MRKVRQKVGKGKILGEEGREIRKEAKFYMKKREPAGDIFCPVTILFLNQTLW